MYHLHVFSCSAQGAHCSSQLDTRLWLECRVLLAKTLAMSNHRKSGESEGGRGGPRQLLLECSWQCAEGVRECEACGEVELCSTLHYTAALHAMAAEPMDLDVVVTHVQVQDDWLYSYITVEGRLRCVAFRFAHALSYSILCVVCLAPQSALHQLESLSELSPSAHLLRCRASLLLAEVACVQGQRVIRGGGTIEPEMAQVFEGLAKLVREQVNSVFHIHAYMHGIIILALQVYPEILNGVPLFSYFWVSQGTRLRYKYVLEHKWGGGHRA